MKYGRVGLLVVVVLAVFVLAPPEAGRAQNNAKPLAGKTLYWGADCDGGIPYVMLDKGEKLPDEPNGPVTGFEADLRDALEKELGCRIAFKQLAFDNLLADVQQGNCHFAMNGLEITPEKKQLVDFSKPYYLYQQQFVVRANEKRFATLEECRSQGSIVGTLSGCAAVGVLQKLGFSDNQIRQYKDQDGPYKDLRDKQIDGVLLDLPAAIYYAASFPQLEFAQPIKGLKFLGVPFADGYYGIAVRKGSTQLRAQLDAGLDALRKNGELKRILVKWELWNLDQYKLSEPDTGDVESVQWTFDRYFPLLLEGSKWTVIITVLSFALAMALGLPLALLRLYGPWPLRTLATLYVEFFRGIPVLLLLYFLYYGSGQFSSDWELTWLKLNPYVAAVLGFGLNYAAYEAEIYRAGIGSIAVGQWEAAASLGMAPALTFRRIVLPQAVRVILPPMTNDFVALFKDTSVVSIIAVTELSTQYQILTKSGGGYVQIGLCTAALYLVMSVPLGYLSRYLEKRWIVER